MKIEKGMVRQICFYPPEDVENAFEKAEGAESKSHADELATLREFYLNMKFFFNIAIYQSGEAVADEDVLATLYAYAKKGAGVTA